MESFHDDDGPLNGLLEGEGQHDRHNHSQEQTSSPPPSFAPPSSKRIPSRLRNASLPRLRLHLHSAFHLNDDPQTWWHAATARFGYAENAHFLEHFRYTIIASQLLQENPDFSHLRVGADHDREAGPEDPLHISSELSSVGVATTVVTALVLARLVEWIRESAFSFARELLVFFIFAILVVSAHLVVRRSVARHIQDGAVKAAVDLVSVLQAFETTSTTAFSLVQEVELVAKGFKLLSSSPLPPISRIDDAKALRRCLPLRRQHFRAHKQLVSIYGVAHEQLQQLRNRDDYDKFIDVYDVPKDGIIEAQEEDLPNNLDPESLGSLRLVGYRAACLRRAIMCDLLALEAGNNNISREKWRQVISAMNKVSVGVAQQRRSLQTEIHDIQDFVIPPSPYHGTKHNNDRLRTQLRKISNVSSGIRSIQAKMALLHGESNAALAQADDLTDLGPTLMCQYESIGTDIKALVQDWENGKTALSSSISKHERRISMASSGDKLSPLSITFSGMTIVNEGSPADALRALNGEGRSELSFSPRSSMPSTPSDEEVFEAVAMPKQRSTLSREERIKLMQEERIRAEERRETRESGMNMMRELRSVINVRQRHNDRDERGRITSI